MKQFEMYFPYYVIHSNMHTFGAVQIKRKKNSYTIGSTIFKKKESS